MVSGNSKTGPIPVTVSSKNTCPSRCPLKKENGGGCYASTGRVNLHWSKLNNSGLTFEMLLNHIKTIHAGRLWRMNVAGDLCHYKDKIDSKRLESLTEANKGRKGFTYTHHDPTIKSNAKAIAKANKGGFTVNLSADSLAEADKLADLNIAPVVTVLNSDQKENTVTPKGRKVIVCPNYTHNAQCMDCQLCQKADRSTIVGFPAHGIAFQKVNKTFGGEI